MRTDFKRIIDVAVATVLLVCLAPLLAGVAFLVKINLGGPVLFRQKRNGLGGQPFTLVKFRSMRPAKPGQEGPEFDHARVTRFGKFLRSTSLDELPELINVLRGDMSLVGPRPLPISYFRRYNHSQARRHEVRPGITGWAQINGRNAIDWESRFALDLWYVENRSIVVDAKILAATVKQVLRRDGIDHAEGVTMTEFLGRAA